MKVSTTTQSQQPLELFFEYWGRGERKEEAGTYVADVAARDGNDGVLDTEREVRQIGITVKDPATVDEGVGRAGHIGVVGLDDGGGQVDQGGAGVSNADNGLVDKVITDAVAGRGELPVAGQLGHGRVGEITGVGGVVDPTDIVRAG